MCRIIMMTGFSLSLGMLGRCGYSTGNRSVSGAGIAAGARALGGLMVGAPLEGALVGGAEGAGTGALTSPDKTNLGRPLRR